MILQFKHVCFYRSCAPGYCANAGQDSPNQINGALVGGPGRNDDYEDKRDDYIKNEVSVISNGVFQTAVAGKSLRFSYLVNYERYVMYIFFHQNSLHIINCSYFQT